jgi:transcription initiation factor TFIIE subunit alpha
MLLHIDEDTIIELAVLVGGENAGKIMKYLLKRPGITDEELSRILQIDIKEIRKILHKLNEQGILHYELAREKDTGHRIFRWYVGQEQVTGFIITNMKKILERLEERLEYEKNHQFYWCETKGCRKLPFEEALDNLFKCPVCGKPLQPVNNEETIKAIELKIDEIKRNLEQISRVKKIEEKPIIKEKSKAAKPKK